MQGVFYVKFYVFDSAISSINRVRNEEHLSFHLDLCLQSFT